jgi:hypothetical protein
MKNRNRYYEFLSEFMYWATEAEDDWKDEPYDKLTTELQELTILEAVTKGTFQEFSDHCV